MAQTVDTPHNIPGTEAFPLAPETDGRAPTDEGRIAMARAAILSARVELLTNGGALGLLRNKLGSAAEQVRNKGDSRIYKVAGVAIAAAGMPMAWALLNKGMHLEMDVFDAAPQTPPSVLDLNQHHTTLVAETEPVQTAPKSDLHNVDIHDGEGSRDAAKRMGMDSQEAKHFALSDDADAKQVRAELVKSGDAYWAEEKGGVIGWKHGHELSDDGLRALRAYDVAENHDGGVAPTPEVEVPEKQPPTSAGPVISVEKALDNAQIPEGFEGKVHAGENGGGYIEVITPKGEAHRIDLPEGSLDKHGKLTATGQEAFRKGLDVLASEDVFGAKRESQPSAPPKVGPQRESEMSPDMWMAAGTISTMGLTASLLIPSGIRRKLAHRRHEVTQLYSIWLDPDNREDILQALDRPTRQRFVRSFENRMPLGPGRQTDKRVMRQLQGIEGVAKSVRRQLAKHELKFLPKEERTAVAEALVQRLYADMGISAATTDDALRDGTEREFVGHVWAAVKPRRARRTRRPLPVR